MPGLASGEIRVVTFQTGLWLGLIRAAIVAVLTVAAAVPVANWVGVLSGKPRRILGALFVAILFTPMLVIGYVYSSGDLTLVRYPMLNELLYGLLLCAKFLPIAVGVLYFGPPSAVSESAKHCARLVPRGCALSRKRLGTWWALAMQGRGRAWLLAGIAVFLLSFQEFELASLLNGSSGRQFSAYTWTIALREAREVGVPMSTIWQRAAIVVAIQLVVIGLGFRVLMRSESQAANQSSSRSIDQSNASTSWMAGVIVFIATLSTLVIPWLVIARTGVPSLRSLFAGFMFGDEPFQSWLFTFGDELFHSLLFAAAGTALVFVVLATLRIGTRSKAKMRVGQRWAVIACCVPGLIGGLVLSLVLVAMFQPLGLAVYDSPLPLLVGLVLWLLPMALLLRWLFDVTEQRSASHVAKLTQDMATSRTAQTLAAQLMWQLHHRWRFWLVSLVFSIAYFELILSVLLAPTSMTTAMSLLYNLFHYGQNAVRSAMVLVMVTLPIGLALMALLFYRLVKFRANAMHSST